jgi:hypothetical protein
MFLTDTSVCYPEISRKRRSNDLEIKFLTDLSVGISEKNVFDRRLSVENSKIPHVTENIGQKRGKSFWRPNNPKGCRSPLSFFAFLTDLSVGISEKSVFDRRVGQR